MDPILKNSPVFAVRSAPNGQELAVSGYDGKIVSFCRFKGSKREISIAPLINDHTGTTKIVLNKNFEPIELVTSISARKQR